MTACNYITDMKEGERKTSSKSHSVVTLEDLNITKNKSSQWQRLVAVFDLVTSMPMSARVGVSTAKHP